MDFIQDYYFGDITPENYKYSITDKNIRLSISGSKMIQAIDVKLNHEVLNPKVYILYKQGEILVKKDISNITKSKKAILEIKSTLLANTHIAESYKGTNKIDFQEATYDIDFEVF